MIKYFILRNEGVRVHEFPLPKEGMAHACILTAFGRSIQQLYISSTMFQLSGISEFFPLAWHPESVLPLSVALP